MKDISQLEGFLSAERCLPFVFRQQTAPLPPQDKAEVEELRFRVGQPITVTVRGHAMFLENGRLFPLSGGSGLTRLSTADLELLFATFCRYSVHACQTQLRSGFVTLAGGHRAGVCGTAVTQRGRITALRQITSIDLRVARSIPHAADALLRYWHPERGGLLLAGPPGSGKTTVLRDLVRQLPPRVDRIALLDERGELAGAWNGRLGADIGPCCDVLDGYPKAEGILIALRTLSPRLIVCDEIGGEEDARAVAMGANAGVTFAASIHAGSLDEAVSRPQTRRLLQTGAFTAMALLEPARRGEVADWRSWEKPGWGYACRKGETGVC